MQMPDIYLGRELNTIAQCEKGLQTEVLHICNIRQPKKFVTCFFHRERESCFSFFATQSSQWAKHLRWNSKQSIF